MWSATSEYPIKESVKSGRLQAEGGEVGTLQLYLKILVFLFPKTNSPG